jgi:NADH-quinone oxidoreductase subunit N
MTPSDLLTVLPHIIVAVTAVCVMLAVAIHRSYPFTAVLTLLGLFGALAVTVRPYARGADQVTALLTMDTYARFYVGLILAAGIVVAILSYRYVAEHSAVHEEYYIVMLVALLGCMVLASSSHFASTFLGLELLSVSLYVLIAYPRSQAERIEAGIKYLVLAAVSVSFLLFGMALVYAASGTMEFGRIVRGLETSDSPARLLFLAGVILMTVGFGFKLALVPFHLWAPDVYQGAPTPVTAFIATASKGAVFAAMLRFFTAINIQDWKAVFSFFAVIAVVTMFVGNLLALRQDNIKRLLGYSSIAHIGYVLVAFLAGGALGVTAVTFYFLAYFATMLGVFGVLTVLSDGAEDLQRLDACRGLVFHHPYLGTVLTLMLLSLAGIPLTAGFIGKFYVLGAGVRQELHVLVVALVVNSAIGLYYYLRIIVTVFTGPSVESHVASVSDASDLSNRSCSFAVGAALGILVLALLWIGAYPTTFMTLVDSAASSLK